MIKRYLMVISGLISVYSTAHSLEFTELNKEVFTSKVVGKKWMHSSIDATLRIQPDGSVIFNAPKGKFVGEWEFIDDKGFCREGYFAGTKVPYACEDVKLVGDRIFIFVNEGKPDDPYILLMD